MAKQWPGNLGVGKPYDVDERLENFIALQCYERLNDRLNAEKMRSLIINQVNFADPVSFLNDFISALVLKDAGNKEKADSVMENAVRKNPSSKPVLWCKALYDHVPEKAQEIARETDSGDQDFVFLVNLLNIK